MSKEKLSAVTIDWNGNPVFIGDKVFGEGCLECNDGYKIDRTPIVTVNIGDDGILRFGKLSASSFTRFWKLTPKPEK